MRPPAGGGLFRRILGTSLPESRHADGRDARAARARERASELLADARKEITQADQKASILLAASGVVVSVFLGALLDGTWSPEKPGAWWQWVWWSGTTAFGAATLMFAMAVFPRLGSGRTGNAGVRSYLDVVRCPSAWELRRRLERSHDDALVDTLGELRAVSRIAYRKYTLLRAGLLLLAFAMGCGVTAALAPALGN